MADAEKEIEKTKARYLQLVDEVEQVRDDLIGANETRIWAALFPSEHLASMAPAHNLAGASKQHMRQWLPGIEQGIEDRRLLGLLRVDAEHYSSVMTTPQAAASKGVSQADRRAGALGWHTRVRGAATTRAGAATREVSARVGPLPAVSPPARTCG